MNDKPKRNLRLRKLLLACTLALILLSIGFAVFQKTPWVVPADAKSLKNPIPPSEANITATKQIYQDRCVNCHGDTGKGDGSEAMMYDPPPADLTNAEKMSKVTDGEIYYQITEGRKPMPSFKKRLTESQRWQLVYLVRSFAGNPTPPADRPKPGDTTHPMRPIK
jgi:mono/diheme cytochrome c family protein